MLQLTGQAFPFLAGRKAAAGAIRSYSGIPHPPSSEAGGTVQNSQYGDEFAITRIEGQGNGGRSLVMTRESELAILGSSTGRIDQINYLKSKGPIGVKVVDPLKVPAGNFEVWFRDITALPLPNNVLDYEKLDDATWFMVRLDGQGIGTDTIFSDRTIEVANEQLIPDWGISVTLDQTAYSNSDKFTVPLDPFFEYIGASEIDDFWYLPIVDQDGDRPNRAGDVADRSLHRFRVGEIDVPERDAMSCRGEFAREGLTLTFFDVEKGYG